jgi:hypothetical protein
VSIDIIYSNIEKFDLVNTPEKKIFVSPNDACPRDKRDSALARSSHRERPWKEK